MAHAQTITIPVGTNQGSLTYTYSAQSTCDGGAAYQWYNFTYIAPDGTSTSLNGGSDGGITYLTDAGCGIVGGWDSNGNGSTNGNSNEVDFSNYIISQDQACTVAFDAYEGDPQGYAYLSSCVNPAIVYPKYKISSIIYNMPGNKSNSNYGTSTTDGTRTSFGSNFTQGTSTQFTEGSSFMGFGGTLSVTNSTSTTTGNSSAFTFTFTNGASVQNASNNSNPNAVIHSQDEFIIWLNPAVSILPVDAYEESYSIGTQNDPNGQPGPIDQVQVFASEMEANSQGNSSVDPGKLVQQLDAITGNK